MHVSIYCKIVEDRIIFSAGTKYPSSPYTIHNNNSNSNNLRLTMAYNNTKNITQDKYRNLHNYLLAHIAVFCLVGVYVPKQSRYWSAAAGCSNVNNPHDQHSQTMQLETDFVVVAWEKLICQFMSLKKRRRTLAFCAQSKTFFRITQKGSTGEWM